ncbi:MAG: VWA domain-containing protein [Acidobacteria bacterium]|nr:VWA domain-containing protein [Acidobacteriota bacterium]
MTRGIHPVAACTLALCGLALTLGLAAPLPQTPPPSSPAQQTPTFRTRIDAVTVDVIATDKQGKPVTDLTAADFEIKENGKVQAIDSFKRILVTDDRFDPDPVRAAPITSMEAMEREAARDDVRLVTIFLDDYHTRLGNSMAIREKLAKFVRELEPKDLVAVIYPLTPTLGLTFSRDHDGIANAIMKFEGRKYNHTRKYPQEDIYNRLSFQQIEELRNVIVIEALEGLNVYLGTLRQGRKTVLFVSEGMSATLPVEIATGGMVQGAIPNSTADQMRGRTEFFNAVDLLNRMRDIFSSANRTNTSIYTLDPRGLATGEFDVSEPHVNYESDRRVLNEATDNLRVIADQTDGRAIVGRNDPLPELRQMLRDTSAYYLLGYTSTEAPRDGKFHEIKVSIKRKGVELRSRKGYWAMSPDDVERAAAPSKPVLAADLAEALASVSEPERGHPVRTWVGFDRAEDGRSMVTLVWETAPNVAAADAPEQLSVVANFVTGDLLFRGKVARDPQALKPSGRVSFPSKPGAMRLRLTAESASGQLIDSEERELVVPDYTKVGPTATPPLVFRAQNARELQQIRQSTSALPTTARDFARTEQLLIRFKTYGPGGTPPAVTMRLLNAVGDTMSTFPPPERKADGSYDVPFSLGGLVTGSYLIEIEVATSDLKSRVILGFKISA